MARWGGDEFVAVIPNSSHEIADDCGAHPGRAGKAAADIDGRLVGATVSTGMAFSSHGAFELPAMLQADQALYRAKSEGRNRLAMALPDAAANEEQEPPPGGKVVPITRHSAAA